MSQTKTLANLPHLGQAYSSPFDEVYPYSEMGRWVCDTTTGALKYKLDRLDSSKKEDGTASNLTGEDGDVMVKVPAYYYKVVFNSDGTSNYFISDITPNRLGTNCPQGFKIHPAFVRTDGTIMPYFLKGAFKGYLLNGQLRSITGVIPTRSRNISQFRTDARNGRDNSFGIMDFYSLSALQILYLCEFQSTDSQSILGKGKSYYVDADVTGAGYIQLTTGDTIALGDRSGYLNTGRGGDGYESVSYRGIEDFFGSCWEFIDGILIKDDGYYHTNNPNYYGSEANSTYTPANVLTHATTDGSSVEGYVKKMEQLDGLDFAFLPKELGGGATTYYTDYFWSHRKTQTNICIFGARWANGALSGAFCLHLVFVASSSDSYIAASLRKIPMEVM